MREVWRNLQHLINVEGFLIQVQLLGRALCIAFALMRSLIALKI